MLLQLSYKNQVTHNTRMSDSQGLDQPTMEQSTTSTSSDFHIAKLTKGMEHMRPYVSVPSNQPAAQPSSEAHLLSETSQDDPDVYGVPSSAINPPRQPAPTPSAPQPTSTPQKRTDTPFQFGSRLLTSDTDVFSHNAWDHVEVDSAFLAFASEQYQRQKLAPVSDYDKTRFNAPGAPEKWWNKFYSNNAANFFKDRKWLFQEFPVLTEATRRGRGSCTVLELGAGAGNTAFPILAANENEELRVHACDFSGKAVEVIRGSELYDERFLQADVWDMAAVADDGGVNLPPGIEAGSVDVVIMIFVFSALAPSQWAQALRNVFTILKPGGQVLFRDYGRGDLAQVRFKTGRYLEDNFYVRGDGTRVYFFEQEELEHIFGGGELDAKASGDGSAAVDMKAESGVEKAPSNSEERPKFEIMNLAADRRMLVNRQRKLKMYRCWMQGQFRKPETAAE